MKKNALITGSTSGIGLAVAHKLAEAGFNVILNGFGTEEQIKKEMDEIKTKYSVNVFYNNADLSKKDEILKLIDYANKECGGVDVLVNNAGIQLVSPIEDFPDEKWEQIISINLSSSFYLIKNTIKAMKEKKWGRIINIASTHGLVASANKSAYVSAKHGIIGLTKTVALETAGTGVTCNAICPGWVLTPLVQKQIDDMAIKENIPVEVAKVKLLSEKQPSKIFTRPEDIGAMAVHLTTDYCANMTGVQLTLDGGWTAQ